MTCFFRLWCKLVKRKEEWVSGLLKLRWIFSSVGFPSVGKSTLLTTLAGVYSEVAAYEFTTLTTVPGVIRYKGAKIQLLDLPGIIEGAKDGKGRGRQVIAGVVMCSALLNFISIDIRVLDRMWSRFLSNLNKGAVINDIQVKSEQNLSSYIFWRRHIVHKIREIFPLISLFYLMETCVIFGHQIWI